MRPYQIYATKAVLRRVLEENRNGYVWHTTGSGKTLTSFKCASLLRDNGRIDKVFFLVDRKDLDDQTVDEYNSFEEDCVDNTDSTAELIKRLKNSGEKMLVTTIQKLACALRNEKYKSVMEAYKTKKCVFVIDECHRSQFGKMHGDIRRSFQNANFIGFTGTPIFEENKGATGQTTADIFNAGNMDACLHKYLIKEAIADGNVLKFSVEYQNTFNVVTTNAADMTVRRIVHEQSNNPNFNLEEYCKRNNIDISNIYSDQQRIELVTNNIFGTLRKAYENRHGYLHVALCNSVSATSSKVLHCFQEVEQKRLEDCGNIYLCGKRGYGRRSRYTAIERVFGTMYQGL
ncbi:MAG: DEAD/DEAH box helicase family protein [Clostridium sp.]|nr:MAG: DEAD/DEAH box helicase family protein [Clostridium sp.]